VEIYERFFKFDGNEHSQQPFIGRLPNDALSKQFFRMKMARDDPEKNIPVPFLHVFGSSFISYILPFDPVFTNEEEVFKYRLGEEKYQSAL
jgi:hypothetical protein